MSFNPACCRFLNANFSSVKSIMSGIAWPQRTITSYGKILLISFLLLTFSVLSSNKSYAQSGLHGASNSSAGPESTGQTISGDTVHEGNIEGASIFSRVTQSGPVVFFVLLILVAMSIVVWAVVVTKWRAIKRQAKAGTTFIEKFWESRSLNDLNAKINEFEYSPEREIFIKGYAELLRGNQMKGQAGATEMVVQAAMDNLNRSLQKARTMERQKLEQYMPLLAIGASACPFIGLFGTVWGIMRAFEGIAQTGNASLSAVAPGISEALIATAFGLAAAIPAAIGYNLFAVGIKRQVAGIDSFIADFLNIIERYLVTERIKSSKPAAEAPVKAN